jgi:hypothetical protein
MSSNLEIVNKYNTVIQHKVLLADTQNLIGEVGRGSGKTTEMFAPRIVRVSYSMPRSTMLLVAPTYTFIMDTIVPGIITYLGKHYVRGVHYEYGKEPPKHFWQPYTPVGNWKHTISFAWGTVLLWGSLDRPESMIGKNDVHVFVDEFLRIKETEFVERVLPTLRGDREIHGKSQFFGGITGFSSTPNFENDYDWWLEYEKNVNEKALELIEYVAFRVLKADGELINAQIELEECQKTGNSQKIANIEAEISRLTRFISRWNAFLLEKRKEENGQWAYIKGSSFSNLGVLGLDYIKRQYSGSKSNVSKFLLSILGIRPERVKEMFFALFGKHNIFTDSYKYRTDRDGNTLDSEGIQTIAGEFKRSSLDLKHCDPTKPLVMGFDPGNFMSCAIGQERGNDLWFLKDFCVWTPKEHYDLAMEINEFFKYHERKLIRLWCDRAAEKRLSIYANNTKGKTDVAILIRCLEDLGWRVEFMNPNQRTIEYWEHHLLLNVLLGEKEKKTPRIRFCQYECERTISCIYMSPLKRVKDNWVELDKSSEVKLDYEDQQWYSTQLPSAVMYLLFGLYEKYKPAGIKEHFDIPGL